MTDTNRQYDLIIQRCEDIFLKKTRDYGTAWRVLRTISIVDQIYIKAYRIRTIQEKGQQKIDISGDDIASEFIGIINYSLIGLMQLELSDEDPEELDVDSVQGLYQKYTAGTKRLMEGKNHDYGKAWRNLTKESLVDLILMKIQRMRRIIAIKGNTIACEGLEAKFHDMIHYAVFALMLMEESKPV